METKIIVLIDFSPFTLPLLKFANAWSEKSGFETLLIHQLPGTASKITDIKPQERNIQLEKNKSLRKILELVEENFSNNSLVKTEIITSDLIDYLKNVQDKDSNTPLLVGMKGNESLNNPVMGKLTKSIIENLNCLTVIVPSTLKTYLPNSLTVGLSCKFPLNKLAFNIFLSKVSAITTHIRFISIIAAAKEYKRCHEYLLNLSMEYGHKISAEFEIFEGISAFRHIKEYIAQLPDTTFVVQKGEKLFTDKVSHKFLINDLVYDSSIPLVIIPQ